MAKCQHCNTPNPEGHFKLERVTEELDFTGSTTSKGKRIHQVLRKDAGNNSRLMPCRELSTAFLGKVVDEDYMEAATTSDPAYILHNGLIETFPASASSLDSRVIYIDTSITVADNDSPGGIEDIPQEAESVIVLGIDKLYIEKDLPDRR
jgi:hypothetical protein